MRERWKSRSVIAPGRFPPKTQLMSPIKCFLCKARQAVYRRPFHSTMRPLTEEESKAVFTKLANYIVRGGCLRKEPCLTVLAGQEPRSPD